MSDYAQERFKPVPLGASATYTSTGQSLGGFLAKVAGTLTIVDGKGRTIVTAVPVAIGWNPIPFYLGVGYTVTTAASAEGVLAVG